MPTSITLGSVYKSNGRNVLSGSQSQIDTESLINALVGAKRQPAVLLETRNKVISSKLEAYSSLSTILTRLQTATDVLRNPPGVQNASKNIFEYRTASLSATGSFAASTYLGMTVQPGAAPQNFKIDTIDQLAKETKQETISTFSLPDTSTSVVTASGVHTAGLFSAGTISLRSATGGTASTVTLNANDSLQTVVSKFNEVKGNTGIQANILKVAAGSPNSTYKIIFTATKTGETYEFDMDSATTVTADADGVMSMLNFNTTQPAQNAELTIDGVDIERETNAIDDVIDGITFTLKQPTAGAVITATVSPDTEIVSNAITEFADAYNAFRLFVAQQQELGDDGLPLETAVLANETLLRTIVSQVSSEVTDIVDGLTGGLTQLRDIGISLEDYDGDADNPATKNIMVIDPDALASSLAANFDEVRDLFEFQLTANNSNLSIFSRTNDLAVSDFTLNIDTVGGIYQATYNHPVTGVPTTVNLTAKTLGNGFSFTGPDGSALEGLVMLYTSTTSDPSITVSTTQGFGDRFYNLMNSALNKTDGTLVGTVQALDELQTRNENEIAKVDDHLETYRDQLIEQYARLEGALTKANNLLTLLDAQSNAAQNN